MKTTGFHILFATLAATFALAEPGGVGNPAGTGAVSQPVRTPGAIGNPAVSTPVAQNEGGFYEDWIKGRLALGLTFSNYTLRHGKRPANRQEDFLGNINKLDEEHENRLAPTLEYKICDYLSVGATYMHLEASTLNFNNHEGDGNPILKGPALSVDLTYPLRDGMFVPHVGAGVAILEGDFDYYTWWNLGYSNPESWKELGSPSKVRGNHYRYIDVDDATEMYFTIGISYIPHPHVKLDLAYRRINVDPDCEFGYDYSPIGGRKHMHSTGDFDFSGDFWLLTASYIF